MPSYNKMDLMNCCRGWHDFREIGNEAAEGEPLICHVCGCDEGNASVPPPEPEKPTEPAKPELYPSPHWRDHLNPAMREAKAYEYYEVRPCIELEHSVESFTSEDDFRAALATAENNPDDKTYKTFWTVYGRFDDGDRAMLAQAIGDFNSKEAAFEVMNAILAVPAAARWMLEHPIAETHGAPRYADGKPRLVHDWAHDIIEDLINQSSNDERL